MIDELGSRRAVFVEGPRVVMADGGSWALPMREPRGADPEYDGLLEMVSESEDRAETLRSELALTIFLLTRNYDLSPESLDRLLTFPPGDPALSALQRAVHDVAQESFRLGAAARSATPHAQTGAFSRGRSK